MVPRLIVERRASMSSIKPCHLQWLGTAFLLLCITGRMLEMGRLRHRPNFLSSAGSSRRSEVPPRPPVPDARCPFSPPADLLSPVCPTRIHPSLLRPNPFNHWSSPPITQPQPLVRRSSNRTWTLIAHLCSSQTTRERQSTARPPDI